MHGYTILKKDIVFASVAFCALKISNLKIKIIRLLDAVKLMLQKRPSLNYLSGFIAIASKH
jgi:hypothetical protein